jgi:hypothetical protein
MPQTPEEYEGLELVKEYPPTKLRSFALRLYRTPLGEHGKGYRYHFGFPREMVAPLDAVLKSTAGWRRAHFGFPREMVAPLDAVLKSTAGWRRAHWTERDDFWIWSTPATGPKPNRRALNKLLGLGEMIRKFNRLAVASKKIAKTD